MCVCASMSPGMATSGRMSITSAPAGTARLPVPTLLMRSPSTTITPSLTGAPVIVMTVEKRSAFSPACGTPILPPENMTINASAAAHAAARVIPWIHRGIRRAYVETAVNAATKVDPRTTHRQGGVSHTTLAPILKRDHQRCSDMRTFIAVVALTGTLGLAGGTGTPAAAAPADATQSQGRFRARVSDQQIQSILTRIRTNTQTIIRGLDGDPPRGRVWGNQSRRADDTVFLVEDLQAATSHLEDHLSRQIVVRADVDDLLRRAAAVDNAFARQAPDANVQRTWTTVRRDIDSLTSAYNLSFDWQNPQYSNDPLTGVYRQLDGTYALVPA